MSFDQRLPQSQFLRCRFEKIDSPTFPGNTLFYRITASPLSLVDARTWLLGMRLALIAISVSIDPLLLFVLSFRRFAFLRSAARRIDIAPHAFAEIILIALVEFGLRFIICHHIAL